MEFCKRLDCQRVIDVKDPARIYPALRTDYKHAGKEILTDRGHIIAGHIIPDTYDKLIPAETSSTIAQSIEGFILGAKEGTENLSLGAQKGLETFRARTTSLASEVGGFTLDTRESLKSVGKTLFKFIRLDSGDKSLDSPTTITSSVSPAFMYTAHK